ncbi:HYR domain-containing protein [Halosquirtibacter laminarini]|uniref:HYR domain-containing protein n=1 Tax=Halosquirtibacter laminarini TaxID=3374600 RepID=A0AC61NJE0_9BACT|nr:HYR domain-containing protein [Prolixibacteraceae bacterium]
MRRSIKISFVLFFLFNTFLGLCQLSKVHYIPPFYGNVTKYKRDVEGYFTLYLSTNNPTPFDVLIKRGDGTPIDTVVGLSSSTSGLYKFDTYIKDFVYGTGEYPLFVKPGNRGKVLSNKGVVLTAESDFFVNARITTGAQGGSLTSKGAVATGTQFFAGFMKSVKSREYDAYNSHFISIIATANNTNVTVSKPGFDWFEEEKSQNSQRDWIRSGRYPNYQYTCRLNKGETVTLGYNNREYEASYGSLFDAPTGTEINSTKPIVVNTGSWAASPLNGRSRDIGFDQIVPVRVVGDQYVVVKGQGIASNNTKNGESVIVVATEPNTTITFYDNLGRKSVTRTLANKGDYYHFDYTIFNKYRYHAKKWVKVNRRWKLTNYTILNDLSSSVYFTTSHPTYVYQTITGASTKTQTTGMSFIPPLKCTSDYKVTIPKAKSVRGDGERRLNTVIKGSTRSPNIRINGSRSGVTYYDIGGINNWVTFTYNVPSDGDYVVENIMNDPINVALYGESDNVGSAGYYSGFGTRPLTVPELAVDGAVEACATNTRMMVANDQKSWSYRWYKNESVIPGATSSSYTTTGSGFYAVEAILDCDGRVTKTYPSDPIFLSPCISIEQTKSAVEGESLDVVVSLSESIPVNVSFDLELITTSGVGAAQKSKDFQVIGSLTGLTFPANETSQIVSFDLIDDVMREPDETFSIRITRCTMSKINIGTCDVTIKDNDLDKPSFTMNFTDSRWSDGIEENGSEGQDISLKVRLSEKSGYAISVDYRFMDKLAKNGLDYQGVNGTLNFAPEEQEKEIHFKVLNDAFYDVESLEDFGILLFNAHESVLPTEPEKRVSIHDDELKPNFSIASNSVLTAREGETLRVVYELDTPIDSIYSGRYATKTLTSSAFATSGIDFIKVRTTAFSIPIGDTSGAVEISTVTDGVKELQEQFYLSFRGNELADPETMNVPLYIIDTDAKPQLTFASEVRIQEGATVTIPFNLTSAVGEQVSLELHYSDISATNGVDYTRSTTTLNIPDGSTSISFVLPTLQDTEEEGEESLQITVTSSSSLIELPNADFTVVIEDDDSTPIARDDRYTIEEGASLTCSFADNDFMGDTPIQGYTIVRSDFPNSEIVFDDKTGSFQYYPSENYSGTHTLTYHFIDFDGDVSADATVTVVVNEVDDIPIANDDLYSVLERTSPSYHKLTRNVLSNDVGKGDGVTVSLVKDVHHGTLKLNANGTFEYEPDAQFFSSDTFVPSISKDYFTYRITDQKQPGQVSIAKCQIGVSYYNDFAPQVVDDVISTNDKTPVSINPLSNDLDGDGAFTIDAKSFAIVSKSGLANVIFEDGLLKVTPVYGVEEEVVVGYRIKDTSFDGVDSKTSNIGHVTIDISRTNRLPVAVCGTIPDFYISKTINPVLEAKMLDGGSSDADGDDLSFLIESSVLGNFNSLELTCDHVGNDIPLTLVVTDTNGATSRCSTTINVLDSITPTLVGDAPDDVIYSISRGSSSKEVYYSIPMYHDNCSGTTVAVRVEGAPSGSRFGIGDHLIRFEKTDASGNRGFETHFTITVVELIPTLTMADRSSKLCEGESCELGVNITGGVGESTIRLYLDGVLFPSMTFLKGSDGIYRGIWTNLPKGSHQLIVKVTDSSGTESGSLPLSIEVKGKPSSLTIVRR